jgi:hypothetical protein
MELRPIRFGDPYIILDLRHVWAEAGDAWGSGVLHNKTLVWVEFGDYSGCVLVLLHNFLINSLRNV